MQCPNCSYENPQETNFCGKCATPLSLAGKQKKESFTQTFYRPKGSMDMGILFDGRYQIIEELGEGGMGRVYKVLDTDINELVTLKILKPEISQESGISAKCSKLFMGIRESSR